MNNNLQPSITLIGLLLLAVNLAACSPAGSTVSQIQQSPATPSITHIPTPVLPATQAATNIPTAEPAHSPPSVVSTPTEVSPGAPAGKIFFAGTRVDGLIVDDEYVYWNEPGRIVRQRMESPGTSQPETVVKTIYPNGRFGLLNSQRLGDWLFFFDSEGMGIPGYWTLFALNVKSHEKKAIVQSQDTGLIYAYAVDGDRVAVSLLDHAAARTCQDESVLAVITISTLQRRELDRSCFDSPYNWVGVALSGDMLIASRFHNDTREFELFRYDLKSGTGKPLNPSAYPPVSYVDGGSLGGSPSWLVWEITESSTFMVNPQTGETRQIAPAGERTLKLPQISGRWLYWLATDQPVVYDIQQKTLRPLAKLETNQRLNGFALYGNRAAWVVVLQADQANSDSEIEWADLQANTP